MLSSEMIMHPHDKAALKALKAIPGFSTVVKKFQGNPSSAPTDPGQSPSRLPQMP